MEGMAMERVASPSQEEIPHHFLCPISLHIMADPVILPTGITYDRQHIQRWLLSASASPGCCLCPVTKQPLPPDLQLTPNHTLRRLIQAWWADHRRPEGSHIAALLDEAKRPETRTMSALRRLKSAVLESEGDWKCAAEVLVNIFNSHAWGSGERGEALAVLCALRLPGENLAEVFGVGRGHEFIQSLTSILSQSEDETSKVCALRMIKSLFPVVPAATLLDLGSEFFQEIVRLLNHKIPALEENSAHETAKVALRVLGRVSSRSKKNKVRAVEAGGVAVLIEYLLLGKTHKRLTEMVLLILDNLCGCAEGRAELLAHAAGIAVVSKKILRVSPPASAAAVNTLCLVAKLSPSPAVLQEMLQVGAVSKLCLVLHMHYEENLREKVKETLELHSRVWRKSPCLVSELQSGYPSTTQGSH